MRNLLLALLLLPGCAAYRAAELRAWKKDGACSVACDYHQGYMSTAITLNEKQCRCYTPTLRMFNDDRGRGGFLPLDSPEVVYTFPKGVKYEALRICAYQPWRCPEDLPLP